MRTICILMLLIAAIIGSVMSVKQSIASCRKWATHDECVKRNGCYWNWNAYECYPNWYNPNPSE